MGSRDFVRQYQTARLAEWIGDFATAERIYTELESREQGLARLMRTNVRRRAEITRKQMHSLEQVKGFSWERDQRFSAQLTGHVDLAEVPPLRWEYRFLVVARSDRAVRLDVRGYSLNESTPILAIPRPLEVPGWEMEDYQLEPPENEADLLWLQCRAYGSVEKAYLAVDRWGLLSGMALIEEANMGDTLAKLHVLIAAFGNMVDWQEHGPQL